MREGTPGDLGTHSAALVTHASRRIATQCAHVTKLSFVTYMLKGKRHFGKKPKETVAPEGPGTGTQLSPSTPVGQGGAHPRALPGSWPACPTQNRVRLRPHGAISPWSKPSAHCVLWWCPVRRWEWP